MENTIVAIIGDYYHSFEMLRNTLEKARELTESNVKLVYRTVHDLVSVLEENPKGVIFFAENRLNPKDKDVIQWMNDEIASAIQNYVHNGGRWLAWHSGLASYDNCPEYVSLLRGHFKYHPKEHQRVTYIPVQNDFGLGGNGSFTVVDEQYFVTCEEANTNVFLRSKSVDGEDIAGWFHPSGNGYVYCLTPAHTKEALQHPFMVNLLAQLIKAL